MTPSNPLPNALDGRYEIQDLIGSGGMGAVYRGVDRVTGEVVAIKQLKPEIVALEPGLVERFAREAEALRQLQHPNIVKVLGTFQHDDRHFIVMEFVGGGSLADLLERGDRLPIMRVVSIALELSDALSRAHHLRIIHRDIKPANVLLAEDGTPRLTDFGVARMESMDRMTQTGTAIGTLDYLSPEAINGESVDARADLWAFGVMLYEMLTGQRPFAGYSVTQMLAAVLTQPPPDLLQLRPDAPADLVTLIQQMLIKDREQRIASARLVGAELEAIAQGRKTTPPRSAATPATPEPEVPSVSLDSVPSSAPVLGSPAPVPAARSPRTALLLAGGAVALVVVMVMGLLVLSGTLEGESGDAPTAQTLTSIPAAAATTEATPEATQPPVAVADLALPEGWTRFNRNRVSLAVPSQWGDLTDTLSMDTILSLITSLAGDDPELTLLADELRTMSSSGLLKLALGDLIALEGVVIIEEEIGLTLTPELVELRIRELFRDDVMQIGTFEPVQLAAGDAQNVLISMDAANIQFNSIGYFIPLGTRLYWLMFSLPPAGTDAILNEQIALIRRVAETFRVDVDAEAEASPKPESEETSVVPEPTLSGDPDGWMRYSASDVSLAVPGNYADLMGTGIMETMQSLFAEQADSEALWALLESSMLDGLRMNFGSLANLSAPEGVAIYTEPTTFPLTPDLLRLRLEELYSGDMFEITRFETVQLPAGEAVQVLVEAHLDDMRGGTIYGYLLTRGDLLYSIIYLTTFGMEDPGFDEVIARYDLIAQSFRFREGMVPSMAAEETPDAP